MLRGFQVPIRKEICEYVTALTETELVPAMHQGSKQYMGYK